MQRLGMQLQVPFEEVTTSNSAVQKTTIFENKLTVIEISESK